MVIGNGLIGTEMKKIDKDNILFFCSGVSHSMEVDKKLFQREINLLNDITSDLQFYDTIIYFGSLSNLTNNIFLEHKRNVENQIKKLGNDEKELKAQIEKFRSDEIHHKNIAYEAGATNKGLYSIMDKVIKTSSKIAITISEKI